MTSLMILQNIKPKVNDVILGVIRLGVKAWYLGTFLTSQTVDELVNTVVLHVRYQ